MKNLINAVVIFLLVVGISSCGSDDSSSPVTGDDSGWIRQTTNPLIVPKLTSTTLDFGPADPTVLFDDEDNKWKAWFSSTEKAVASGDELMTIKYSESLDGINWSAPQVAFQAAASPTAWDHSHAETPAVVKNPDVSAPADRRFMLWYSGANTLLAANENRPTVFPYYQIGLAYSADGKSFTRHSPGIDNKPGLVQVADAALFGGSLPGLYGDGLVADPEVIFRDNQFHMWFSSYAESVQDPVSATGRAPLAFGIAHATSIDGINWSSSHDNPLASLAKAGEVAAGQQPTVLFNSDSFQYEMWFSNDSDAEKSTIPCSFNTVTGFWRAVSSDGISWTPDYSARDLTYDVQYAYESFGFLTGIEVVRVNGAYHAYYSAWGTDQIPDDTVYLCPDQHGGFMPAVLTLNRATLFQP